MHEIPVDMSPEHLEAIKQANEVFKPISRAEFFDHMNRQQRRSGLAQGRHADSPVHTVLTMNGPRKVGRNQPCPCGGGKKYKNCCGIGA